MSLSGQFTDCCRQLSYGALLCDLEHCMGKKMLTGVLKSVLNQFLHFLFFTKLQSIIHLTSLTSRKLTPVFHSPVQFYNLWFTLLLDSLPRTRYVQGKDPRTHSCWVNVYFDFVISSAVSSLNVDCIMAPSWQTITTVTNELSILNCGVMETQRLWGAGPVLLACFQLLFLQCTDSLTWSFPSYGPYDQGFSADESKKPETIVFSIMDTGLLGKQFLLYTQSFCLDWNPVLKYLLCKWWAQDFGIVHLCVWYPDLLSDLGYISMKWDC